MNKGMEKVFSIEDVVLEEGELIQIKGGKEAALEVTVNIGCSSNHNCGQCSSEESA
ncbi:MAG: hypothetical protein LBU03_06445 [Tannerellaceae bacterium]|jgi:hypothetical protein|nr:hypothetical protein [Tannerellaceae bacterium]